MNNNQDEERRLNPDSVNAVKSTATNSNGNDQDTSAQNNNKNDESQNNDSNTNDSRTIEGYALKFNVPSKPLDAGNGGQFTEIISPNALDDVDLSNVVMLDNHDLSKVLASTKAGTLQLNVDDVGLHYKADLSDTSFANDDLANIKAGNLTDTSFSFAVADNGDSFTKDDNGNVQRIINKISNLFDVSLVSEGAYSLGDDAIKVDSRSYERFMESFNQNKNMEKRNKSNMEKEKTIINPTKDEKNQEESAFEQWVRSAGKRDLTGLTEEAGQVVVPDEIVTPILDLKNQKYNLGALISRKQVSAPAGAFPVSLNEGNVLKTKEELAEVPDVDGDMFKSVKFLLKTYAGKIYVSDEMIEDSVVDIKAEIQGKLQQLVANTENTGIAKVLTTAGNFQTATADSKNLDDIKKIKNVMLDPALNLTVVMGQTVYNWLDTMKDSEGRYLLQPDVTAMSGKSLFGMPVAEVNDTLMPAKDGMVIADLEQSVFEAYKGNILANWHVFENMAQGFTVGFRADFEPVDKNSAVVVSINGLDSASGSGNSANAGSKASSSK